MCLNLIKLFLCLNVTKHYHNCNHNFILFSLREKNGRAGAIVLFKKTPAATGELLEERRVGPNGCLCWRTLYNIT